jgi:transcriptional accessory protein Tex/SPT6
VSGIIDIITITEQFSDNANIREMLRNFMASTGIIRSKVTRAAENLKTKYDICIV